MSNAATGREWGYSCWRAVHVNVQQGAEFAGSITSNGSGARSDRHCGCGSSFTAQLERISGGEIVTGTLTDDSYMTGSVMARASCMDPFGAPFEGAMTIEFTVTKIANQPQ
jgi:hypothetical protein